jgi:hypothetical protein
LEAGGQPLSVNFAVSGKALLASGLLIVLINPAG